jgi:hypothetical protein
MIAVVPASSRKSRGCDLLSFIRSIEDDCFCKIFLRMASYMASEVANQAWSDVAIIIFKVKVIRGFDFLS